MFLVRGVEDRIWERIPGRNVAIDGAVTGGDGVSVRLGMGGGPGVVGTFLNRGKERVFFGSYNRIWFRGKRRWRIRRGALGPSVVVWGSRRWAVRLGRCFSFAFDPLVWDCFERKVMSPRDGCSLSED